MPAVFVLATINFSEQFYSGCYTISALLCLIWGIASVIKIHTS